MLVITHGCVFKLICCIHLSVIWEEDTCTDKVYFFVFSYQSLPFLTVSPLKLLVCPHKAALFTAMRYWGNTVNCWCHAIKEVLFIFAVHNVQDCPNAIFQIKLTAFTLTVQILTTFSSMLLCVIYSCVRYISKIAREMVQFSSVLLQGRACRVLLFDVACKVSCLVCARVMYVSSMLFSS